MPGAPESSPGVNNPLMAWRPRRPATPNRGRGRSQPPPAVWPASMAIKVGCTGTSHRWWSAAPGGARPIHWGRATWPPPEGRATDLTPERRWGATAEPGRAEGARAASDGAARSMRTSGPGPRRPLRRRSKDIGGGEPRGARRRPRGALARRSGRKACGREKERVHVSSNSDTLALCVVFKCRILQRNKIPQKGPGALRPPESAPSHRAMRITHFLARARARNGLLQCDKAISGKRHACSTRRRQDM